MRRRPRRPAFRQNRPRSDQDRAGDQALLDAGARRLLAHHDAQALESLVHDLRMLLDEADRLAQEQPSPQALGRYRVAARELATAERALTLAERTH